MVKIKVFLPICVLGTVKKIKNKKSTQCTALFLLELILLLHDRKSGPWETGVSQLFIYEREKENVSSTDHLS